MEDILLLIFIVTIIDVLHTSQVIIFGAFSPPTQIWPASL